MLSYLQLLKNPTESSTIAIMIAANKSKRFEKIAARDNVLRFLEEQKLVTYYCVGYLFDLRLAKNGHPQ
jgi:hypothetical protein